MSGYITNKREPDLGTLKNISLKLGVSLDYLLGVKEEEGDPIRLDDEEWGMIILYRNLEEEQKSLILEQMKWMNKHNGKR